IAGSQSAVSEGGAATATRPVRKAARSDICRMDASISLAMRRAPTRKASPSGVSNTLRVSRSKSRAPTISSKREIIWLNAEGETLQRSAATENRLVSSRARNASISSPDNFIKQNGIDVWIISFYFSAGLRQAYPQDKRKSA